MQPYSPRRTRLPRHRVRMVSALLGLVLVGLSAAASPAAASTPQFYELIARNSGQCLDVQNQSTVPGALIQQYLCWGGQNQQWQFQPTDNGYVEVIARNSGQCLDVKDQSTAPGAHIQQYPCWGGPGQQWYFSYREGGYYEVIARNSGLCLDVTDQSTAPGALIQQYPCWGGPGQQWALNAQ
jgi:Ricin-type beta-trefoil lectin domain